jgi:hypothetical protein
VIVVFRLQNRRNILSQHSSYKAASRTFSRQFSSQQVPIDQEQQNTSPKNKFLSGPGTAFPYRSVSSVAVFPLSPHEDIPEVESTPFGGGGEDAIKENSKEDEKIGQCIRAAESTVMAEAPDLAGRGVSGGTGGRRMSDEEEVSWKAASFFGGMGRFSSGLGS